MRKKRWRIHVTQSVSLNSDIAVHSCALHLTLDSKLLVLLKLLFKCISASWRVLVGFKLYFSPLCTLICVLSFKCFPHTIERRTGLEVKGSNVNADEGVSFCCCCWLAAFSDVDRLTDSSSSEGQTPHSPHAAAICLPFDVICSVERLMSFHLHFGVTSLYSLYAYVPLVCTVLMSHHGNEHGTQSLYCCCLQSSPYNQYFYISVTHTSNTLDWC